MRAMPDNAMQVLTPRVDLQSFYARVGSAGHRVLILDYDGTLAPFRVRPEQALPYPGIVEVLSAIVARPGSRVVVVSGRRAADVVALLPLGRPVEVWGSHGWEHISQDGDLHIDETPPVVHEALARAEALAAPCALPGTRFERKPASLAFHWRGLPPPTVARLRERLVAAWRPLADEGVVDLLPFDGGLEMRARGTNKQHAVKAVLSQTPPQSAVAYLGDDITDEDAFQAVKAQGLAVLVRPEYRETAADVWLRPPHELLEFLEYWRGPR